MLKVWLFKLKKISNKLSVKAGLFALLALVSSLAGVMFRDYVPDELADLAGGPAVDGILTMMASSMLLVVTFSIASLLSAYSAATQVATPRATGLIIDDARSHSSISIFLGAFIYSIVSLIALSTGYYGKRGRVILLFITISVLVAVVSVIIRWVEELKNMGSVRETLRRVEKLTMESLKDRVMRPTFGCRLFTSVPDSIHTILNDEVGYIQNIDMEALSTIADANKKNFYIMNEVGTFLYRKSHLVYVDGPEELKEDLQIEIRKCFVVGETRTFDSDPRFGMSVLSGIAVKALSASLNDPGTAIDVISSMVRVISVLEDECVEKTKEDQFPRIYFPKLKIQDLFNDAFYNLTKVGASHISVILALKSAMDALSHSNNEDIMQATRIHERLIEERMKIEITLQSDLDNINSCFLIGENQRQGPFK